MKLHTPTFFLYFEKKHGSEIPGHNVSCSSLLPGTGAVLSFPDGSDRSSIAITILEDDIPERDEDLLIALTNPTGGATVAADNGGTTLVIIEANDNAAGIVGLAPFSRSAVVTEGQVESLVLKRRIGALGVVAVDWEITGPGNVTQEFVGVSGTATFTEVREVAVRADGNFIRVQAHE